MSDEVCSDNRFELIDKAKAKLLEATNIEMRPDEMMVLDSILFRCWQMGWLDKLRDDDSRYSELFGTPERAARTWIEFNGIYRCADCPICHDEMGVTCEIPGECAWEDEEGGYDALLEWLRGDA